MTGKSPKPPEMPFAGNTWDAAAQVVRQHHVLRQEIHAALGATEASDVAAVTGTVHELTRKQ